MIPTDVAHVASASDRRRQHRTNADAPARNPRSLVDFRRSTSSHRSCGSSRLKLAGQAVAKGSDVYLFLIGMMLLSELAREQGVFDWVASVAVRGAKGSCSRLFLLVYGVGTLVTIFMSNDATAVVLTPAILTAVRKAKVSPLPYLFVCALIANAASFVLPISNPANLVVFHTGMPPLGTWLADFGVPSLLSIVATFFVMRFLFRDELCKSYRLRCRRRGTQRKRQACACGSCLDDCGASDSIRTQEGLGTAYVPCRTCDYRRRVHQGKK